MDHVTGWLTGAGDRQSVFGPLEAQLAAMRVSGGSGGGGKGQAPPPPSAPKPKPAAGAVADEVEEVPLPLSAAEAKAHPIRASAQVLKMAAARWQARGNVLVGTSKSAADKMKELSDALRAGEPKAIIESAGGIFAVRGRTHSDEGRTADHTDGRMVGPAGHVDRTSRRLRRRRGSWRPSARTRHCASRFWPTLPSCPPSPASSRSSRPSRPRPRTTTRMTPWYARMRTQRGPHDQALTGPGAGPVRARTQLESLATRLMDTVRSCLESSETASIRSLDADAPGTLSWQRTSVAMQPALASVLTGSKPPVKK
jgi:hypothetical protein